MSVTCRGWEEAAGGGDGRPPAQFLRQLPARRSNRPPRSPLFSSSSPLQVPYTRRLTHFSCLPEPLPGENVVMWCASMLGWWVGLQHWTKASHLRNKDSKESMSFLIRCYCMWDCFSNGVSWPSMCFASVLPHMLTELTQLGKFARQMDNLPNTAGPNESSDTA